MIEIDNQETKLALSNTLKILYRTKKQMKYDLSLINANIKEIESIIKRYYSNE